MTKSTITREESIQAVFDLKVGYTLELADIEILKRVARIALAAMDSEPVAYINKQWTLVYYIPPMSMGLKIGDKLYRYAQPAPVVPVTDAMAFAFHHALTDNPLGDDDVEDIKAGLRAALVNVFNTQPPPQEVHDEK
ncbi:hypothetical protein ACJELT_004238 [Klebsiella pneumoniae]